MSQTIVLVQGDTFEVNGTTVTIAKCGLKSQGGGKPQPSVTVEVSDAGSELNEPIASDSYESLGLSSTIVKKLAAKWPTVAELRKFVADSGDISEAIKGVGDSTELEILAALEAPTA